MGDAAARAERPARRMAVAYMFAGMNMLFEVEGVVDVYDGLVGSDSCVVGRSDGMKAG